MTRVGGELHGQVALVTGGGGGIGREHALALARAGARVVVNDLGVDLMGAGGSAAAAERVVAEIRAAGGEAVADAHSVADHATAGEVVRTALDAFGRIDVLVNNASVFRDGPFTEITPDDFAATVGVHLFGTFHMCRHVAPVMARQGRGRIVNTTSSAWYSGVGFPAYAAAKGGIVSLTYELARELAPAGITVNAIAPGALTEHREGQGQVWLARVRAAGLLDAAATGRPAAEPLTPDFVPPIVVHLASDAGAAITGRVFEAIGSSVGIYSVPSVVRRLTKDPAAGPWTQAELARLLPPALLDAGDTESVPRSAS